MRSNHLKRILARVAVGGLLVALLLGTFLPGAIPVAAQPVHPAADDWLEPRGVSVVDLAGALPEAALADMLVVYRPGVALAFYASGERTGDTVRVRVRFNSKNNDRFVCLGMPGLADSWPTVVPASTLRLFADGTDVTNQVSGVFDYFPAGLAQPITDSGGTWRYPETIQAPVTFDGAGAIVLPANMGCWSSLAGNFGPLEGEFTFQLPQRLDVQFLGEETGSFRSYIGPGNAGQLEPLRRQMERRYADRHDDIAVNPPAGAEFVIAKYPATPVDPYIDPTTPAGGSYRIRRPDGKLSVDHLNSTALPLYGQWLDADFVQGQDFLPFFDQAQAVSSPEYFVPAGVAYDPCMTGGGCPDSLLETIYDATMEMTIYYLAIDRTRNGFTQRPLAAVGTGWEPGTDPSGAAQAAAPAANPAWFDFQVNLPLITAVETVEADSPAGCPCGWFDADGRMVDFVAGE